jgi:hypothetical protein
MPKTMPENEPRRLAASNRSPGLTLLSVGYRPQYWLEALTAALVDLGARHAAYDIQEAHFAVNKRALIETLREALGIRLTPDAEAAWSETHDVISAAMLRGIKSARSR